MSKAVGHCVGCDTPMGTNRPGNFAVIEDDVGVTRAVLICAPCTPTQDRKLGCGGMWELWRFKLQPIYLVAWAIDRSWSEDAGDLFIDLLAAAHPNLAGAAGMSDDQVRRNGLLRRNQNG